MFQVLSLLYAAFWVLLLPPMAATTAAIMPTIPRTDLQPSPGSVSSLWTALGPFNLPWSPSLLLPAVEGSLSHCQCLACLRAFTTPSISLASSILSPHLPPANSLGHRLRPISSPSLVAEPLICSQAHAAHNKGRRVSHVTKLWPRVSKKYVQPHKSVLKERKGVPIWLPFCLPAH